MVVFHVSARDEGESGVADREECMLERVELVGVDEQHRTEVRRPSCGANVDVTVA